MTITKIFDIVDVGKSVQITFDSHCGSGTIQVQGWALRELVEFADNDEDMIWLVNEWANEFLMAQSAGQC